MEHLARLVCEREHLPLSHLVPLTGGQVNATYQVANQWIIRLSQDKAGAERLLAEARLLQRLPPTLPIPQVLAAGEVGNGAYQVQRRMPGESLHRLWVTLSEKEQDAIIAQLAACMQALHAWTHPLFGLLATPQLHQPTWHGWLGNRFRQSVEKLRRLESVFPPAILAQVENHFLERQDLLEARKAVLVHHDLWPGNILVQQGKITAILDFEFATWAPPEYELLLIEQFCLYPNDFVEEERATYACSDFASFIQRLRAQAPALFSDPDLRHRLDLYHIEYVLSAYLAWMERQAERQAGLAVNPVAKVLNFLFEDGVRLFDA